MNRRRFLKHYAGQQAGRLVLLLLCTLVAVLCTLVAPLAISFLIDNVIDLKPMTALEQTIASFLGGLDYLRSNLWVGALLVLGVNLFTALFMFLRGRLNALISESLVRQLRNDLYQHLQNLPYRYHVRAKTGDLIQRCTSDVDVVRRVFGGQLSQMGYSVFISIIALVILVGISPKMSLIAVIAMPILIGYAYLFFVRTQKSFLASDTAEGVLTTDVQENLAGIRVVKAFNREKEEIEKYREKNEKFRELTYQVIRHLGRYWSTSDMICLIQIFVIVLVGIFEARAGTITVGDFFVFISYESLIIYPIRNLGRILADVGKMTVSVDRLNEIFNEPEEDLESGLKPAISGAIQFNHVSFHYEDSEQMILQDVSFSLEAGKTLAILGPTGSGKSSLVHLLCRLYEPTEGTITLDGIDIQTIQKKYLRQHIGIVLQEPFLFSKTIYDNIHVANFDAKESQVIKAAKLASVHDVITDFDAGYNTLVGEKGVTLSGGQKQRIAIARTIINNTPILIFDDSLSAVDTETDAAIRKGLRNLQNHVSMIIITQRIASAQDADEILVLEEGKVTQIGNHATLCQEEGLYKRVFEIQSQMKEEIV